MILNRVKNLNTSYIYYIKFGFLPSWLITYIFNIKTLICQDFICFLNVFFKFFCQFNKPRFIVFKRINREFGQALTEMDQRI